MDGNWVLTARDCVAAMQQLARERDDSAGIRIQHPSAKGCVRRPQIAHMAEDGAATLVVALAVEGDSKLKVFSSMCIGSDACSLAS